jgi:mono/diheme cytochrome c family protein
MQRSTPFIVLFVTAILASCGKNEEQQNPPAAKETLSTAQPPYESTTATPPPSAATNKPTEMTGLALAGQKIYYNTSYGKIKDACASCHADGQPTTSDTRLRPGHTLVGITSRTSTWNSQFTGDALQKNAYGATMCAVMYQHKGDDMATVMPKADIDALNAYYDAIKNSPGGIAHNLKIAWVTKPALHEDDQIDAKAANAAAKAIMRLPGDPDAGKAMFSRTCAYCHGLQEKKVGPALSKALKEPQMGARTVRVGSGAMPFYGKDLLIDQQIADVIAYIQQQLGQ